MAITSIDGEYLVGLHNSGDQEAFATIVRTHYRPLVRRAYSRLGDADAAEDAVQDALLRAFRALPRFGGHGDWYLTAWLYRILDNVCTDEVHRRRRTTATVERLASRPEETEPSAEASSCLPADLALTGAVARLPEGYRQALVLRDIDGMSYAEVAEVAGITEQNARARVSRARAALRRLVAPTVAIYAWVSGIMRRGRIGIGGGSQAAASASNAATSAAASTATVNLSSATDLIVQVTAMAPEQHVGAVVRVAAAVMAVALPVGGVAASNHAAQSRPEAAVAEAAMPEEVVLVDTAPGASTELGPADLPAGTVADPLALDAEIAAAEGDEEATSEGAVSDGEDSSSKDEAAQSEEAVAATDAPATSTTTTTEAPPANEPVDERSLTVVAVEVTRTVLDDGRLEMTADVEVGGVAGRLSVVTDLPENECGTSCRFSGSVLVFGEHTARIRLAGTLTSVTDDSDGARTYGFSGRYTSTDAEEVDLPPKGVFEVSFGSDEESGLVLQLAAEPPADNS